MPVYYPESDGDNESASHNTSKRLVTGDVETIGLNGVVERTVRNKEQNKRRHDALGDRPRKHTLVEQLVVVAGCVQLGISHGVGLVHILSTSHILDGN